MGDQHSQMHSALGCPSFACAYKVGQHTAVSPSAGHSSVMSAQGQVPPWLGMEVHKTCTFRTQHPPLAALSPVSALQEIAKMQGRCRTAFSVRLLLSLTLFQIFPFAQTTRAVHSDYTFWSSTALLAASYQQQACAPRAPWRVEVFLPLQHSPPLLPA